MAQYILSIPTEHVRPRPSLAARQDGDSQIPPARKQRKARSEARPTTYVMNKLKLAHEIQSTEAPTQVKVDHINAMHSTKNSKTPTKKSTRDTWLTYVRSKKENRLNNSINPSKQSTPARTFPKW
jgi:hypothetical protein